MLSSKRLFLTVLVLRSCLRLLLGACLLVRWYTISTTTTTTKTINKSGKTVVILSTYQVFVLFMFSPQQVFAYLNYEYTSIKHKWMVKLMTQSIVIELCNKLSIYQHKSTPRFFFSLYVRCSYAKRVWVCVFWMPKVIEMTVKIKAFTATPIKYKRQKWYNETMAKWWHDDHYKHKLMMRWCVVECS